MLSNERGSVAYEDFYDKAEDNIILQNDSFVLLQDKERNESYTIYFNESISAIDIILNIKYAITFCSAEEKNNSYVICYRTFNTEKLNQLFFEQLNKNKKGVTAIEVDELNCQLRRTYEIFLRNLLLDNGYSLNGSTFITLCDMECFLNSAGKLCLSGDVYIYFNWKNITNKPTAK